jgi:hypothetical protein
MTTFYLLRMRFDYHDGKAPWISQWGQTGPNPCDSAWAQSKTNLRRACIEGKNVTTREIVELVECDGHDFVNFEWLATASVPVGALSKEPSVKSQTIGAVLVTRDTRSVVFPDGRIHVEIRSEDDKKIHLAGFGR